MNDTMHSTVVFDVSLLLGELNLISGHHSKASLSRLADTLERDLINFFPNTFEETHVHKLVEFLRRIERNSSGKGGTTF